IFGPAAGGVITTLLSWRFIFYINLPIGIICLVFLLLSAPVNSKTAEENHSDICGMLALVSAIVFMLLALDSIATLGLLSTAVLASIFAAALSFGLFLWIEHSSK